VTADAKHLLTLHWVVGGLVGDEASGHSSTLASTRYRAIIPARELRAMGHRVALIDARRWRWDPQRRPDVVVVGKLLRHGSDDDFLRHCDTVFPQVTQAREAGVPVVADFCDDHFDHPLLGGPWRWLANQAVLCTVASQRMADAVTKHTPSPVAVIGDPLASPASEPRVFEAEQGLHRVLARWLPKVFKKRLRLVWFGHPNNFPAMARWAEDLVALAAERPMTLTLVTGPNGEDTRPVQQIEEWIDTFNLAHAPRIIVSLVEWSEERQWQVVSGADVVLIPSSVQEVDVSHKSINRLADALNVGRYVVASMIPSYLPFEDHCSLTQDPSSALRWISERPVEARLKVVAGQRLARELASVATIANAWQNVVLRATDAEGHVDHTSDNRIPVGLLTLQSPTLPSIMIRLIEPMRLVPSHQLLIVSSVVDQKIRVDHKALSSCEIIIVHRDFPRLETMPLLKELKNSGKKLIYETDDAFHLIPANHYKAHHLKNGPSQLQFAAIADLLVTSTDYLGGQFPSVTRRLVLPNLLSARLWNDDTRPPAVAFLGEIRVGLLGGKNHQDDFLVITDAIQKLTEIFPNIRWISYGEGAVPALRGLPAKKIEVVKSDFNYERHPLRLASLKLDLILVPLISDTFNRSKSNLKFLESGFLGVPGVYSDLEPYSGTIDPGVDGFLCSSTIVDWIYFASELIRDPNLRTRVGAAARTKVLQQFMLNHSNAGWPLAFEHVLNQDNR
jgi:glycosyltransferase involved in cell wall biosynthesis